MRDILVAMPALRRFFCNLCSSKNGLIVFEAIDYITVDRFEIVRCKQCGLVQTYPRVKSAELNKYYRSYRQESGKRFWSPIEYILNFWHLRRAGSINSIAKHGKILDIGCGRGIELQKLKELGWDVYGTEYDRSLVNMLKAKGVEPFIGQVWEAKYPNHFFDAVSLWHSLEHMTDPFRVLTEVRAILKDDGTVRIAVPNWESWERKISGAGWFHLDVPRHLYHFSCRTLEAILRKSGFYPVSIRYTAPEYDFYSFIQTVLNILFPSDVNLLYKTLNTEQKDKRKTLLKLLFHAPFVVLFAVAGLLFVPLSWIFSRSGTIEVTVKKLT